MPSSIPGLRAGNVRCVFEAHGDEIICRRMRGSRVLREIVYVRNNFHPELEFLTKEEQASWLAAVDAVGWIDPKEKSDVSSGKD